MMHSRLTDITRCLLLVSVVHAWTPSVLHHTIPQLRLRPQRPAGGRLVPSSADAAAHCCESDAPPSVAAAPTETAASKSVLVFGWFFAKEKQLKLVRRVYKKQGFDDIQVLESHVPLISKPRGWYKTFHQRREQKLLDPVGRHFDVCHVMSGGFLNLYLLLAAGVPVQYDKLILDSTPILPKPQAFTRFTRAYLESIGMGRLTKIVPYALHLFVVSTRWQLGASYIWVKNKLRKMRGMAAAAAACEGDWLSWVSRTAAKNDYGNISKDALKAVFLDGSLKEAIFVHNPNDPFISLGDVQTAQEYCKELGVAATSVHVPTKHIETIFRKPRAIFGALNAV